MLAQNLTSYMCSFGETRSVLSPELWPQVSKRSVLLCNWPGPASNWPVQDLTMAQMYYIFAMQL